MNKNKNKFLQPSGLNNQFYGEGLAFQEYIALMRKIISECRYDLNQENADIIVNANSPFVFEPKKNDGTPHRYENGILFIHGLYDSPFFLADLAHYFSSKNFLTYSILLPGHGTIPGDLLNVDYHEWIKTVNYGVQSLAQKVKNVYIAGFSLGGTLAIHQALQKKSCKGLILFAPALKTKNQLRYFIVKHHKLFSWFRDKSKWYHIGEQTNFAKYNSFAFNAGYQACQLMEETNNLLDQQSLDIPIFAVCSKDDETISTSAILNFFLQQKNSLSKMLLYTTKTQVFFDNRIITRNSYYPEKKILDFSHICFSVSPENPFFGQNGKYSDFSHYVKKDFENITNIYSGAISKKNLKTFTMRRLTFNPDYEQMIGLLEIFLKEVNHSQPDLRT